MVLLRQAARATAAEVGPRWGGHTDGAVYECYDPLVARGGGIAITYRWAASPPAGPAAPPDPRVLAQSAIAQMRLRAVDIGIVPEPVAGRIGIIGMPTWMWVQDPGPSTLARSPASRRPVASRSRLQGLEQAVAAGRPDGDAGPAVLGCGWAGPAWQTRRDRGDTTGCGHQGIASPKRGGTNRPRSGISGLRRAVGNRSMTDR